MAKTKEEHTIDLAKEVLSEMREDTSPEEFLIEFFYAAAAIGQSGMKGRIKRLMHRPDIRSLIPKLQIKDRL